MVVTRSKIAAVVRRVRRAARGLRGAYRKCVRPRTVYHHGIKLPISEAVSEAMREILYAGGYEEREYESLTRLLRPGDRVLELGSGIGFITVLCSKICGSSAVTTVEANPQMLATLALTFAENSVSPKVISGVVARDAERRTFFVSRDFWSSSTYDRGGQSIEVVGLPFVDLVAEHRPTVIVMDIEGGEVALVGLPIHSGVRAVIIELHASVTGEAQADAVRAWLVAEGFAATSDWGNRSITIYERSARAARL